MAQFVHNSWPNSTTGFAPFELLIGAVPRFNITKGMSSRLPAVKHLKEHLMEVQRRVQEAMHHAQRLIVLQGERKRGKRTFKPYRIGDKVWLEGTNLKLSHPSSKLAARRYGPFKVSKVISPVVYQLELPTAWKIFNTFHAALLSPYKKTEEHGVNFTEPPPDLIEDHEEYEVEQILDARLFGWWKKCQYLIKWKGYTKVHNSWEPEENVNVPELVKEFHQQTGASVRLRVLKSGEKAREPTMTQPVNSTTPLPYPHSPRLLSSFSIDRNGDYPLLDQILLDGPMLQQPWYDNSSPYTCQAAHCEAVTQEA